MRCPVCHAQDTKVTDSRLVGEGEQVRRRRECICCQARFTTYESVELSLPRVIKQDGCLETFNQDKLKAGMLKALEKRPVHIEQVESALNQILKKLQALGEKEVSSRILGDWVMAALLSLDEVAYVRFASVYRKFQDVFAFEQEIARIKQEVQDEKNNV